MANLKPFPRQTLKQIGAEILRGGSVGSVLGKTAGYMGGRIREMIFGGLKKKLKKK